MSEQVFYLTVEQSSTTTHVYAVKGADEWEARKRFMNGSGCEVAYLGAEHQGFDKEVLDVTTDKEDGWEDFHPDYI